mmetsp:Transcript_35461/g.80477  ORF Transcript_35461/g.80477 Transcript_35461/m.80477 type:complete len:230 (+) Transcript_35461:703-1392(+)
MSDPGDPFVTDLMQEERCVRRHGVQGPLGVGVRVEKLSNHRCLFQTLPHQKQDGDHAAHLVPQERVASDRHLPNFAMRVGCTKPLHRPHLKRGDRTHKVEHHGIDLAKVTKVMLPDEHSRRLTHRRDVHVAAREEVLVGTMRRRVPGGEAVGHRSPRGDSDVWREQPVERVGVVELAIHRELCHLRPAIGLPALGISHRSRSIGAEPHRDHLTQRTHTLVGPATSGEVA